MLESDKTPAQNSPAPIENAVGVSTRYGSRRGSPLAQIQVDRGTLSSRSKRNALIFIVLGLLSIAAPVIEFDPSVHGQKYWSVWEMSQQPQIEIEKKNSKEGLFDFGATFAAMMTIPFGWVYLFYAALVAAAVATLVFPFRKLLLGISLTGIALLFVPFRGSLGMMRMLQASSFQSDRGGNVRIVWLLFAIEFAILTVIAWTDTGVP